MNEGSGRLEGEEETPRPLRVRDVSELGPYRNRSLRQHRLASHAAPASSPFQHQRVLPRKGITLHSLLNDPQVVAQIPEAAF